MFKAVVFDMDGVLLDTEKVYRICWKKNGMSLGISEAEMNEICDKLAGGTKKHNAGIFKEKLGEDFDYLKFRQKVMDMFESHLLEHGIEIKPGVAETLQILKQKGIPLALATSTDREHATDRLLKTGLFGFFDETVFGDEIENGKPSPDIYLKACNKLGVLPETAIGVEDSMNGVIAASAAGLYTVMVVDLIKPNEIIRNRTDKIYVTMTDMLELF